jgi:hypothetical protein
VQYLPSASYISPMALFNLADSKFKQRNKILTKATLAVTPIVSKCGYNQWNFDSFAICRKCV